MKQIISYFFKSLAGKVAGVVFVAICLRAVGLRCSTSISTFLVLVLAEN